jgi:putative spermidine/putrescine transport system ATP-binding protein
MASSIKTGAGAVLIGGNAAPGTQHLNSREPIISVRGLAKTYHSAFALNHVDLDVHKGEFLTLLGPSGSGKTTLLGLIAGIMLPTGGRIELLGRDISRVPPEERDIGVVFQNYALFPHMTVRENVGFPLRLRGLSRSERAAKVAETLALVRLGDFSERYPSELSGGQQQRVALARALVFNPAILLMDEPLSALDKKLRDHMKTELRQIQQALGLTIIYVTHDQEEALALSTRIALMQEGRIRQIGFPEEIYERPQSRFVADFIGDANLIEAPIIGQDEDSISVTVNGDTVRVARRGMMTTSNVSGRALVMVRPEHIVIGAAVHALENRFSGRVVSSVYEGAARRLEVDVDGTLLRARSACLPGEAAVRPGEHVDIGWATGHAHLVELNGS